MDQKLVKKRLLEVLQSDFSREDAYILNDPKVKLALSRLIQWKRADLLIAKMTEDSGERIAGYNEALLALDNLTTMINESVKLVESSIAGQDSKGV